MFPTVSVVIPSLEGQSSNLERLRDTILSSGIPKNRLEIIATIGVSPNGRARDVAVPQTSGEYLICMDDDVSFPDPADLKQVVEFLDTHDDVGLCGPAQQLPEDLSRTERRRAQQIPRTHTESSGTFRETDMVTHACLSMPRKLFIEIGMEHPNLISGTDPDLRYRVRKAGYRVGLVPDTRVVHPPIKNATELIEANFNGGRQSKWVQRNYGDYHLKADPKMTDESEYKHSGKLNKLTRHIASFGSRLFNVQEWALLAQLSYIAGYSYELVAPRDWVDPIPYPEPPDPESPKWEEFLDALKNEGEVRWLHGPLEQNEPNGH